MSERKRAARVLLAASIGSTAVIVTTCDRPRVIGAQIVVPKPAWIKEWDDPCDPKASFIAAGAPGIGAAELRRQVADKNAPKVRDAWVEGRLRVNHGSEAVVAAGLALAARYSAIVVHFEAENGELWARVQVQTDALRAHVPANEEERIAIALLDIAFRCGR